MIRRLLFSLATLAALAAPARADFAFTPGSGATAFDFTCFTTKHCFASVPIDSAGTEIFTSGAAGYVRFPSAQAVTVPTDPFGANADAGSATGSISAKLRFIAATGIPITGTVTVASHAVTNAGTFATQSAVTAASGSYSSGAFASGSIASGAMVDLGAIADAAATAGSTGSLSAKQRLMTTQLATINTTLGTPFQAGGSIGNTSFGATLAAETTKVIGTTRNVGSVGGIFDAVTGATAPANALQAGMAQGGNLVALTGTSGNLNVQCANCSGSGVSTVDAATFTASTSLFAGTGGFFQTTATNNALTNGQQGMWQMTATRAGFVNLRNNAGAETGVAAVPLQVSLANTAANATAVLTTGTGGTFPIATWGGGTLGAMANYGTSPGAVLVPGVNAFVTNSNANGQATMANSSPVTIASNQTANALWGHGATGAAVPANATYVGIISGGNLTGWTGAVTATLGAETTKVIGTINQRSQYPSWATALSDSDTGTTGATTSTLAAAASETVFVCGFSIRANATAAVTGNATLTGTITSTMNFTQWTAPTASGLGITEMVFTPCVPASATNTAIAIVSAAPGTGGVVSTAIWGYRGVVQ